MLQRELVQVQTLMNNMTREKEDEFERLKSHYEQLQADHTTSEVRAIFILVCRKKGLLFLLKSKQRMNIYRKSRI